MFVKTPHYDVAALVEAKPLRQRLLQHRLGNRLNPGTGGVDQHPRGHDVPLTARIEN